jgi:hypothetical protein
MTEPREADSQVAESRNQGKTRIGKNDSKERARPIEDPGDGQVRPFFF